MIDTITTYSGSITQPWMNEFTIVPPHIIDTQQAYYDNVVRFDKQLATLEKQLIDIDASKTKYNLGIKLPPDTGVNKDIDPKHVRSTIPEFHENHPHMNLYDYFHKLMQHARLQHWSHQNIKDGIGLTTMGEPYRAWEANQDRPLPDIIKAMENEFSKGGGMNQNKQDARNFVRHEGEELRACVTRFQRILRKTDYKTDVNKAQCREELRLEQMITTVCSPSALIKIEEARIKSDVSGIELTWQEIFRIAEHQELLHKDLPREPRSVNMPFTTDRPVRETSPGPDRNTFGVTGRPLGAPRRRSGSPYERPNSPGTAKPSTSDALILPKAPNEPAPAAPPQQQRQPQQQPQQQQFDSNANQGGQQGGQGRPSRNRFRNNTFGNNPNNTSNQRNPNNPNYLGNQNQQQPTQMEVDINPPQLTIPFSQPQQNMGYQQPQQYQNTGPQYSAPKPTYSAVVPQQYQQPQQTLPPPAYQPPQDPQQYQQPPQQQLPWNQQPQVLYGQPPQQPPQGQWPQQRQQFQQGGRRGGRNNNNNNNNSNQRNPNNPNFAGNQNWKPPSTQFQVQPSMNVDPNQPGYPTMTANYFPTGTFNQDIRLNMQAMGEAMRDTIEMDIEMKDQNQRRSPSPNNQRRSSSKQPLAILGPGQVYVPPPEPNQQQTATCFGCGLSHQHNFSNCYKTIYGNRPRANSPPRTGTPSPPPYTGPPAPTGPPKVPRTCPHCNSTERHTYRFCAMNPFIIAKNQGKGQG